MQNEKRTISPLLYYLLTAGLTNLVFVAGGAIVYILLAPPLKLDPILMGVIFCILLQKSLIVGYVIYSFHKQGRLDKAQGTKFIGFYPGRFYGLFIGALIGFQFAKGIGALIGAVIFYFIGRWIGFRVGFAIGRILDRNVPMAEMPVKVAEKPLLFKRLFVIAYMVVFPLLMMLTGLLLVINHIQFLPRLSPNTLSTARIVVIAVSIFSLVAPWFIRSRIAQKQFQNLMFDPLWLGLALSVAPGLYGFLLFTLGASIIELGIFAVVSSLAVIIWSARANLENLKAG